MDRRQIATKLVLDELGLGVSLRTFDERLITQKTIYLAQAAGVDLGYYYRWYLRGPYCPDLTADVFGIESERAAGFDKSKGWVLDDEWRARLDTLKDVIGARKGFQKADWLELLASVHFLVTRQQVSAPEPARLREVLRRYDKNFSDPQVAAALTSLQQHDLLSG